MTTERVSHRAANFIVVTTIAVVTTLSLDMIVPSLTVISRDLATSYPNAQLTIGVFLFAYAFSQLTVNSVTAVLGEKKALVCALLLYTVGSIVCYLAPSIIVLLVGRVLQALGSAYGPVLARAIVRTQFEGSELKSKLADLATVAAIVPIIAPILGGYLTAVSGWRSNFIVLIVFGIAALLTVQLLFRFQNGQTVNRSRGSLDTLTKLFSDNGFRSGLILLSATYSMIFVYVSLAPRICVEDYHLEPHHFSYLFGMSIILYLLGTRLATVRFLEGKSRWFSLLTLVASTLALTAALSPKYLVIPFEVFVLSACLFNLSAGYFFPLGQSLLLSGQKNISAAASSYGSFVQTVSAALISLLATYLSNRTGAYIAVFACAMLTVGILQHAVASSARWQTKR
ncbi:MFS transporter [Nocardia sp. NPDC127526]|uniref:MFS transporter n=1 Tax=Nocardia sp. NPDC127526 TaxID=3345393 RepID=UPI003639A7A3